MSKVVLVESKQAKYCKEDTFRPSEKYPEYMYDIVSANKNYVYEAVREAFHLMGFDHENYGTENWNPLSHLVKTGDTVLIKPNMVMHVNYSGEGEECLYTQPSVVAPVIDYVVKALNGKGHIILADAPMQACDFDVLIKKSGYDRLVNFYRKNAPSIIIELKDMRGIKSVIKNGLYEYHDNSEQKEIIVKLNENSEFAKLPAKRIASMRITDYDPDILKKHHNERIHEYAVSEDILKADVVINMPKCKMHRKAGITAALKNCVGICTRKEYLPHHTNGALSKESDACGGDAYYKKSYLCEIEDFLLDWRNRMLQTRNNRALAHILNFMVRIIRRFIRYFSNEIYSEGSWYGNNTISKTITDLNKILFYADKNGKLHKNKMRKYLIVADMIIAGHKDGPLSPSPAALGLIGVGDNPVTFDEVIATLYKADMNYMHAINQARSTQNRKYPLVEKDDMPCIISSNTLWNGKKWSDIEEHAKLKVEPCNTWKKAFYV